MPTNRRPSRIIRKHELPDYVGLKKSALDNLIDSDESFPKPFKVSEGGRAIAWFEDEIIQWQDRRRASREVA